MSDNTDAEAPVVSMKQRRAAEGARQHIEVRVEVTRQIARLIMKGLPSNGGKIILNDS